MMRHWFGDFFLRSLLSHRRDSGVLCSYLLQFCAFLLGGSARMWCHSRKGIVSGQRGIPFGFGCFKIAKVSFAPLGKRVIGR